jgi:predicted HTH domain antitoxin
MYFTMNKITLHLPDKIDLDPKETTIFLAAKLYENGRLSLGHAAELAGLSKFAFAEILGNYGVSLINYPAEDIKKDVSNA